MLTVCEVAELSLRLSRPPLTRFAPAPTGWLHLGHVLNAEYRVGSGACARRSRAPPHRGSRLRAVAPEFEGGILDDLDWLGYRPDIYTTDSFRAGTCAGRQAP